MGYGALRLEDRQGDVSSFGTFGLHFSGGYAFTSRVRAGLALGGWLIEPFDIGEPTEGRAVSHLALVVQGYPLVALPLRVEAAGGTASYTDRAPTGSDAGGSMWMVGASYDLVRRGRWRVSPGVQYARAHYGRPDLAGLESARAHEVFEARIGGAFSWGAR